MSIAVALDELPARLAEHPWGYLVTTGSQRPHLLAVTVEVAGEVLRCTTGGSSRSNVARNPLVVMVFPPATVDGMSLIVDGTAVADDAGVLVTPTWAVLHRSAR